MALYNYTDGGTNKGTPGMTAVGLLSRYYLGWNPIKNPGYQAGAAYLAKGTPPSEARSDMYYYYYATQVMHFRGGEEWAKWNTAMRDLLINTQMKAEGKENGSWKPDGSHIGTSCGRLGTTCLSLLTLEVYYRHLPLYSRDAKGTVELER